MAHIFISHSSNDNGQTQNIHNFFEKHGVTSIFLDYDKKKGITFGENWEKRLYKEIKEAQVVILLLSPSWCSSRWCFAEYAQARALGKDIYPIIIERGNKNEVDTWVIDNLVQKCDLTNDPNEINNALEVIKNSLLNNVFEWDKKRSPYPGMISYEEADAHVFFGREDDIKEIIEQLKFMRSRASSKFLNIIAASGMGKSSLLKAGILPRLKKSYSNDWIKISIIRPKQEPLVELVSFLCLVFEKKSYEEELYNALKKNTYEESLNSLFRFNKLGDKTILLSVDQAEELYSVSNKEEKKFFMRAVSFLLKEREEFFMLWTLRSDFLKEFQTDSDTEELRSTLVPYILSPIKQENITDIIEKPARIAEIDIDNKLIDKIKNDIKTTDSLPLLALCLNKLYNEKGLALQKEKRSLTIEDYKALAPNVENPLEEIIQKIANESIRHFSDNEIKILKYAFIPHMISINNQNEYIKKEALWEVIPRESHKILEELVKSRLLIKQNKGDKETIEIAHEALIRNWDLLLSWIEEEKDFLVGKPQLEIALHEWQNVDESEKNKALLNGLRLQRAVVWLDKNNSYLTEEEKEFIQKSIDYSRDQEKKFKDLYFKAQEEVVKVKHNIGLVLLEKAKSALSKKELAKVNIFSFAALKNLSDIHDNTRAKISAKNMIVSYPLAKLIFSIEVNGPYSNSAKYSVDGNTIISGSSDNSIKMWDAASGKCVKTFEGHEAEVTTVGYSPDGRYIVSGSIDKTVRLWNVESGELLHTFKGDKEWIISVAYSPDGKYVMSLSHDGIVNVWDTCTKEPIYTLKNHHEEPKLTYSAYSSDGEQIITGSLDNIKIWNVKNGTSINLLKGHKSWITYVFCSSDGKYIISGSHDRTIKVWNAANGKCVKTFKGHEAEVTSVDYSPDGRYIVSGSIDKTVRLWNVESGELLYTFEGHREGIRSVAYSPDGRYILALSVEGIMNKYRLPVNTLEEHEGSVESVAYSPDGKNFISGSYDKTIKVWEAENGKCIKTFKGHEAEVTSVTYSPDGKHIVSGSIDKTVRLWNLESGELLYTFEGHQEGIRSVAYSLDGKEIILLSFDGILNIWNVTSEVPVKVFEYQDATVECAAYSLVSKHIVLGLTNGEVSIWNIEDDQLCTRLSGHDSCVTNVVYTPDGKNIISRSDDHTIKRWDVESGSLVRLFESESYEGEIGCMVCSPSGKHMVSGSTDKTVRLWDVESGRQLHTFEGHQDWVESVVYSPDGGMIVSGSKDGTIRVWDVNKLEKCNDSDYVDTMLSKWEKEEHVRLDGVALKKTLYWD